jgi:hypothetical protein
MSAHTHKMVNGARIALTAQEIAELDARDAAFAAVELPARQAKAARTEGLRTDQGVRDLDDRLRASTAAQIDQWFAANVTTPAQAIAVLKTVCKILAVR